MFISEILGRSRRVFDKEDETGGGDEAQSETQTDGSAADGTEDGESKSSLTGGLLSRRSTEAEADTSKDDADQSPDEHKDLGEEGRPEGLSDKFWDAEKKAVRTDELAKSYAALEAAHGKLKRGKAIGGEVPKSADDYFPEGLELGDDVQRLKIDGPDDVGLKAWAATAHKYGLGKELAMNVAKEMITQMDQHADDPVDPDVEFDKLGKGGEALIDGVFVWAEGMEASGRFSESDVIEINRMAQTADGIKLLAKVREMTGEQRIPIDPGTGARGMSQDQWQREYKQAVKDSDYAKQEYLDEMAKSLFSGEPSRGGMQGGVDPEKNYLTERRNKR